MLGRKTFTQKEIKRAQGAMTSQLVNFRRLASSVQAAKSDKKAKDALAAFEADFFNNLVLALDRPFVHRVRMVTGKECTPLNEVELICESLMNEGGVFRTNNVLKYDQDRTVIKLAPGDSIALSADDFERLSDAFFRELKEKFLTN